MCLACEDVVLGYGCVGVFILESLRSVQCEYYGSNCCVAAVVCLACEDVMLGYGCVGVFIVLSVVKYSLRVLWQQLLCTSGSVSWL